MATNFPGSQDNFTNPTSGSSLSSPSHSQQHSDVNDAVEAIEGALLDGAPLHIDDANERVGIGTTSPARTPLHVHRADTNAVELHMTNNESGSTSSDGLTIFYDDVSNGAGIWVREASPLRLATSGSERVRIDSSGNVGIGDTTPSYKLDVNGEINASTMVRIDGSNKQITHNNYQSVYVGGSASTWYPVTVYRGHNIPQTNTIYKHIHDYQNWDGSLVFQSLSMSNEWGGNPGLYKIIYHSYANRQFIGQISSLNQNNTHNVYWLLGGGRTYWISTSPLPDQTCTVYLTSTVVTGTTLAPITSATTVGLGWEP